MCGIWFYFGKFPVFIDESLWIKALSPRGPECLKLQKLNCGTMGFTRLAINGLNDSGMQPFSNPSKTLHWVCNGEIYNWRSLYGQSSSGSDCEVLGGLYEIHNNNLTTLFRSLDGVFATVIVDEMRNRIVVARDPYGVRPLYVGVKQNYSNQIVSKEGDLMMTVIEPSNVVFASEIKAIGSLCDVIYPFPPGTYQVWDMTTHKIIESVKYHTTPWIKNPLYKLCHTSGVEMAAMSLRWALEQSVKKRLMTERPMAALLSGGIDSSLIASLVQRFIREGGSDKKLKTFSIGMNENSSDLVHARMVAKWINSDHHEIVLSVDDFFKAIPRVIRAIETFDTTTVRASVGNWLVAKAVAEQSDCKVVFNGDGSDEVFGSYLYFYSSPGEEEFEEETNRLLENMHMFDVQRSDRTISSHGLEPRTPFLDKEFVAVAKSIDTKWRRPVKGVQVEKWILRKAFDDGVTLPSEVLWRKKEAFSDGVSGVEKSWYEEIQERVIKNVPEDWKERAERHYTHLTPETPEQYYYRFIYESEFGKNAAVSCTPYLWMPNWSPGATDPSARTLAVYS